MSRNHLKRRRMPLNRFDASDLLNTLSELGIKFRESGDELQAERCPFCEKDRKDRSDHFAFNRVTGVYNCVKCEAKGNLITFRREMGVDPFPTKIYRKLDQPTVAAYSQQQPTYYESYQQARGVRAEVLKKYGVGKATYPGLGMCRTYPYIDQTGEIVNVKYVNREKEMRQEKDTKHIYFGLQFVKYDITELMVCEGEDDCMALVGMGFDNVVSLPNGAGSYTEEMGVVNAKFKKILMFFDNDKAGQEGAQKFARKAGVWKCWNVILPFKDVRDCLMNGFDIFDMQQLIGKAAQFEYSTEDRNRPALSAGERFARYEKECETNAGGIQFGYKILDELMGGLRRHEILTIVANPECYKTTLLMNLLIRGAIGLKTGFVIFFSLEMSIESEFEREMQIVAAKKTHEIRNHASKKTLEWESVKKAMTDPPYSRIFVSEESNLTLDEMASIIKKTEDVHGEPCALIGIDYIDFVKASSPREYDAVRENMNGIKTKIARGLQVPVIVLAQTNRQSIDADNEVGMRSGKGGTGLESASDFMIGLWKKGEEEIYGRITKHRRVESNYSRVTHPYLRLHIDRGFYKINEMEFSERPESDKPKKNKNGSWHDKNDF